jgi:FAD/FMN-containing dehydrogenase
MATDHQSIYLLGGNSPNFPYLQLIENFSSQGTFLSATQWREYLACYDRDSQSLYTMPPLLVFRPHALDCLGAFIQACAQLNLPITARCGGTGLTGCAAPSQGGVVLLTGHFRKVIHYDPVAGIIHAEPGVNVSQINRLCKVDGWFFPLEMATNGVAGVAGGLSCQAQGYHQSCQPFLEYVLTVHFINGQGQMMQAPSSLMCGAEGLFGIVTQLEIKLKPLPQKRVVFQFKMEEENLLQQLNEFKQHQSIVSLIGMPDKSFVIILEGEAWRVDGAIDEIKKRYGPLCDLPNEWILELICPSQHYRLSQAAPIASFAPLLQNLSHICAQLHISYQAWTNMWEGSLHLILTGADLERQMTHFLVLWCNVLEKQAGFLISRHGVGPHLRHYLPPFFSEEELHFLQQLSSAFDPHQLFNQKRFFPSLGKSLEKVEAYAN